MTKETFIHTVSNNIRRIRHEFHWSQDRFSEMIGITKKTLVQIEKERVLASWSVSVTTVLLFENSETIKDNFGENPRTVIEEILYQGVLIPKNQTMGGKFFWSDVFTQSGFVIQKNLFSNHYRLIDGYGKRYLSGFNYLLIKKGLEHIIQEVKDEKNSESLAL